MTTEVVTLSKKIKDFLQGQQTPTQVSWVDRQVIKGKKEVEKQR